MTASREPAQAERFALLATALSGRKIDVVPGADIAYTDGESIFVGDGAAVRPSVIVQALLLGSHGLSKRVLTQLRGKPDRSARFLLLEMNRLCAADGPWSSLRSLIAVPDGVPTTLDVTESLASAESSVRLPAPPSEWGEIRPGLLLRRLNDGLVLDGPVATEGGIRVGGDDDPDGPTDDRQGGDRFSMAVPLPDNPVARMVQKLIRLGRSRRGQTVGGQAGEEDGREGGTSRRARTTAGAGGVSWEGATGDPLEAPTITALLPEWDLGSGSYRESWCTVIERTPEIALQRGALEVVSRQDLSMRKRLAKIGLSPEGLLRQPVGDDIDVDAAVRARIELEAGSDPGENHYVASRHRRRELSVLVLLDVSGSARDPSPAGGTVFDRQQEAAACLVDSITALGARTACLAFHSHGRKAVNLARIKTFEQHWGTRARERMASLRPGGYTRLGAAIRHATTVLARENTGTRRLLVLLSDGFPHDNEYRGAYAAADSRRALAEARHESIGCLCISIGAPAHDQDLADVFGSAAYGYAPDLRSFRTIAPRLFVEGLRTSDPRRRLTQRVSVE